MQILTLISDLKLRDPYVSLIKAGLLSLPHDVQLADITHTVALGSFTQTAFLLSGSYGAFPEGTLHLIYTNCLRMPDALPVLVSCNGHHFIGADNGIFSLFLDAEHCRSLIYNDVKTENHTLIAKIAQVVDWFLQGEIEAHAKPHILKHAHDHKASFNSHTRTIEGNILYVDSDGNAITNIPVSLFHRSGKGHPFKATLPSVAITTEHYSAQTVTHNLQCYLAPNIMGYIELKMPHGNIVPLTGIRMEDKILIEFNA
ncbi:MAG: SAM-dependent chlorinase/fluorinase [Bacteroidales bacterium]|jgi:S-adenosylmethionine hydrolase|nr:SAM-dependent chlorinase/fluorinase [Bacteroidales bacterium]